MTQLEIFRVVAIEFVDVDDITVKVWLELTKPLVSQKRFSKIYEQAVALLTAHRMKMSGLGDSSNGSIGDTLRVSSFSEGQTSISFNTNQQTNLQVDGELALTSYGLQFMELRRTVAIGIISSGEGGIL